MCRLNRMATPPTPSYTRCCPAPDSSPPLCLNAHVNPQPPSLWASLTPNHRHTCASPTPGDSCIRNTLLPAWSPLAFHSPSMGRCPLTLDLAPGPFAMTRRCSTSGIPSSFRRRTEDRAAAPLSENGSCHLSVPCLIDAYLCECYQPPLDRGVFLPRSAGAAWTIHGDLLLLMRANTIAGPSWFGRRGYGADDSSGSVQQCATLDCTVDPRCGAG